MFVNTIFKSFLSSSLLLGGAVHSAVLEPEIPAFKGAEQFDSDFLPKTTRFPIEMASRASWYGPGFIGNLTANGETYTGRGMTAAHKTLPFGTRVRVTNRNTNRSVVVRINDRGPFVPGRSIDLSVEAARRLGIISSGTAPVSLQVLN